MTTTDSTTQTEETTESEETPESSIDEDEEFIDVIADGMKKFIKVI